MLQASQRKGMATRNSVRGKRMKERETKLERWLRLKKLGMWVLRLKKPRICLLQVWKEAHQMFKDKVQNQLPVII